jgi:hypothetical protein
MPHSRRFEVAIPEMTGDDFMLALFPTEAKYGEVSKFYGSDRRTGHRWTKTKPSTPVARNLQLIMALGLTLSDAKFLIEAGVDEAGGGVLPKAVLDISSRVALLRAAKGDRHDIGLTGSPPATAGAEITAA